MPSLNSLTDSCSAAWTKEKFCSGYWMRPRKRKLTMRSLPMNFWWVLWCFKEELGVLFNGLLWSNLPRLNCWRDKVNIRAWSRRGCVGRQPKNIMSVSFLVSCVQHFLLLRLRVLLVYRSYRGYIQMYGYYYLLSIWRKHLSCDLCFKLLILIDIKKKEIKRNLSCSIEFLDSL